MYSLLYNKKVGDSSDEGIGVVSTPTTLLSNPKISQEEVSLLTILLGYLSHFARVDKRRLRQSQYTYSYSSKQCW